MTRRPKRHPKPPRSHQDATAPADVHQLRRDLADAQRRLREVEEVGADAYLKRRLAELDEARLVARGQALEAAADRAKAQAELRALRDAIEKAPGLSGWLMRRAAAKLSGR